MASRRMFSRAVVMTNKFSKNLSKDARLLYFYIGLEADDDGFLSSSQLLMLLAGVGKEALDELIKNGYILDFDSDVILVRHWRVNNQIRADRYSETLCQEEKETICINEKTKAYERIIDPSMVTKRVPNGLPLVAKRLPQYSIGKVRLEEVSEDKSSQVQSSVGETESSFSAENFRETSAQFSIDEIRRDKSSLVETSVDESRLVSEALENYPF